MKLDKYISKYGSVDISVGVPDGLYYCDYPRACSICKKNNIEYAKAFTGFIKIHGFWSPMTKGIVISDDDKNILLDKINEVKKVKDEIESKIIEKEINSFSNQILIRFPKMSLKIANRIAEHATEPHSGRIGDRYNKLDDCYIEDIYIAATIAYIRHNLTDYEELLDTGCDRDIARDEIKDKIKTILDKYI